MAGNFPEILTKILIHVTARTGRRVQNLDIELCPDGVVLRGSAESYYVKQLAQHGVLEILPNVRLQNSIKVA